MRYGDVSCEEYCTGVPNDNEDALVMAAHAKAAIGESINDLRSERWGFCSLTLDENNKDAKIVICNRIAFEISCESEYSLMDDLAKYTRMFNELNKIFVQIERAFPRLISPTLQGLHSLRANCIGQIVKYKNHIKSELSDRMGLQSKNKTVDDVLNDPLFKEMKKEYETYIEAEETHLTQLNAYIADVEKIVGGE